MKLALEKDIQSIKKETYGFYLMIHDSFEVLVKSLQSGEDQGIARALLALDEVRSMSIRIGLEQKMAVLIATKQPVARDLRKFMSNIFVVHDLQRVGEYLIQTIGFFSLYSEEIKKEGLITDMVEKVFLFLERVFTEYLKTDFNIKDIQNLMKMDDEIDLLHLQIQKAQYEKMESKLSEHTLKILYLSRNLERCGDHIVHICARMIYGVNGVMVSKSIKSKEK